MKGRGSRFKSRMHPSGLVSCWRMLSLTARKQGYTIVEVMIFLAVTAVLFTMIATTFSSRQARTEFSVAVREMESRLQDIANDISTGYYNNPGNFSCTISGGAPQIISPPPGGQAQGTNNACILIGRTAQFDLDGSDGKQFNLYSVVGARQAGGEDVEDFDDARPLAIATSARSAVDLTEVQAVPPGLIIRSIYAQNGATRERIRAVGFFTSFGAGTSDPASLTVNILPLGRPPVGNTKSDVVNAINTISNLSPTNPSDGIVICMEGDNTSQHALLQIGGRDRQLTTGTTVGDGTCASVGYPA